MPLAAGTRLGPYEIISPLGAGGMGEVYRARDRRLERDVAVKVLPEHLAENPQALGRFARETRTLAALSHPNLLAIFDTGDENGVHYAVTELLEGETLRAVVSRGPCAWRRVAEIGAALADGLAAETPGYLSPEQIRGEQAGPLSDIFRWVACCMRWFRGSGRLQGIRRWRRCRRFCGMSRRS